MEPSKAVTCESSAAGPILRRLMTLHACACHPNACTHACIQFLHPLIHSAKSRQESNSPCNSLIHVIHPLSSQRPFRPPQSGGRFVLSNISQPSSTLPATSSPTKSCLVITIPSLIDAIIAFVMTMINADIIMYNTTFLLLSHCSAKQRETEAKYTRRYAPLTHPSLRSSYPAPILSSNIFIYSFRSLSGHLTVAVGLKAIYHIGHVMPCRWQMVPSALSPSSPNPQEQNIGSTLRIVESETRATAATIQQQQQQQQRDTAPRTPLNQQPHDRYRIPTYPSAHPPAHPCPTHQPSGSAILFFFHSFSILFICVTFHPGH
ncbi:unnamed protein product [Periconia digitata]|uniref:Uncharacterized protein n=1 Tax=Periconia digitata TaxID=1303443 RepID=A0A9W4XHU9_9PLEO|nr:unnamed protein product [Periconia digitata]